MRFDALGHPARPTQIAGRFFRASRVHQTGNGPDRRGQFDAHWHGAENDPLDLRSFEFAAARFASGRSQFFQADAQLLPRQTRRLEVVGGSVHFDHGGQLAQRAVTEQHQNGR